MSNALKSIINKEKSQLWSENELDIELKRYLQSQFTLRRKRIDWFSSNALGILRSLLEQHVQLRQAVDAFIKDRDETSLSRIRKIIQDESNDIGRNVIPMMKMELNKVEDYLESAYLVNKLPEILEVSSHAMVGTRNRGLTVDNRDNLLPLRGLIVLAINNIKLLILQIEEERKVVGLSSLD